MDKLKRFLRQDLWILLLDIIAVNGAYLLALLIRFYVHFRFTSGIGDFREYYLVFTPYYTLLCLLVFFICGLYDGMWRYAGLSDMNRIILASAITTVIQVAGTKLFVHSMPTSYYIIGAFLQFLMIAVIRFAYRFFLIRKQKNDRQRDWTIPALVVGSGDCGKHFIRYLDEHSPFQVVVIAGNDSGKVMNGIPIVDYASIPMQIKYHDIKTVFIADEAFDQKSRAEIMEAGVEVRDYIEYLSSLAMSIPLRTLISVIEGPLTIVVEGEEKQFGNAKECLEVMGENHTVKALRGAKIELEKA